MTKPKSPFGPGWKFVTVTMACHDGAQTQNRLWKNIKTGELRWHTL